MEVAPFENSIRPVDMSDSLLHFSMGGASGTTGPSGWLETLRDLEHSSSPLGFRQSHELRP